ncbi:MAG: hypothetical protein Q4D29_08995 [Lachnospiraceae bacterium]|nr:hypothetical protein [Lachnospiraceae bacterium]
MAQEIKFADYSLFGGHEICERQMVRFGSPDSLGYEEIAEFITKELTRHALDLFRAKKVLLNNRICENNSMVLKEGSSFSIRGYGKYIYNGEGGRTRKDRVYVKLSQYV